ncbi:tungstate ABC transporter substrate-binding protein WtpA [candidate division WOR-3 bacterium]|nr:tungstate ABC transporter substrate-binding protein WtpA [candidate division WOR-3 bacterium]
MKGKIGKVATILAVLGLTPVIFQGCSKPQLAEGEVTSNVLSIYHAGSLSVPFEGLKAEFIKNHPGVEVIIESGGSAGLINKIISVIEAGETPPDIIASADYTLIPKRLYDKGYASWYIAFARNELVLCYRDGAPGSEDIINGTRTWFDVLRNDGVTYGHSNPDDDPCGYRSLMVIQLTELVYFENAFDFDFDKDPNAEKLYDALIVGIDTERGRIGGKNENLRPGGSEEVVRAKSVDLISSLQSGDLDYAFEYRSVAVQHSLNYFDLHPAVNLGSIGQVEGNEFTYEDFYKKAVVKILTQVDPEIVYSEMVGEPVVYGITIVEGGEGMDLAIEFIQLILSEKGRQLMEESGQPFLLPFVCDHPENLPKDIKALLD